jgi:hypothetical protein
LHSTQDPALVRSIACHPSVWPGFGGKSDPETWTVPIRDGVDWLIGDGVIVCFMQMRPKTFEAHIGALPEARGTVKAQALEAIQWLRENRGPGCLLGFIPRGNVAAIANARAVGMKVLLRMTDRTMCGMEL